MKEIKTMFGRDYLREQIRIRDNYTCQKCGKKWEQGTRRFDVHHIGDENISDKNRLVCNHSETNLITMCHKCHMNEPETRKSISNSKRPFRRKENLKTLKILNEEGLSVTEMAQIFKISRIAILKQLKKLSTVELK